MSRSGPEIEPKSAPSPGIGAALCPRLDPATGELFDAEGRPLTLRRQSRDVLRILAGQIGAVVGREALCASVWPGTCVTDDSLVQCIGDIRRALGPGRDRLQTVPRQGYRLLPLPAPLEAAAGAADLPSISLAPLRGDPHIAERAGWVLRVALGRYRDVRLIEGDGADYQVRGAVFGPDDDPTLAWDLVAASGDVVRADQIDGPRRDLKLATRAAAAIASPLSGAIHAHILAGARGLAADRLSGRQVHALGFRAFADFDDAALARRTLAALDHRLDRQPEDGRAHAMRAAILAEQSWTGVGLPEPGMPDRETWERLSEAALAEALAAERLVVRRSAAVDLALGRAFFCAGAAERTRLAMRRALELNPDDPSTLGSFGNWIAYGGYWTEGVAAARRALELEPVSYGRHWWWPIAKDFWRRGAYADAHDAFLRAFDARNWLCHVQMAYTLPFLGRLDEARASWDALQALRPGFRRADAVEAYRRWHFDPDYIARMDDALSRAGAV